MLRKIFTSHHRWCKHFDALNSKGEGVYPDSNDVVRYCLVSAINKVFNESKAEKVLSLVARFLGNVYYSDGVTVSDFNDKPETKFKDIVSLCKKTKIW